MFMETSKTTKFSDFFKSDKAVRILFTLGLAIIALIFVSELFGETSGNTLKSLTGNSEQSYEVKLERELAEIISSINGAGSVKIMITLDENDEHSVKGAAIVCPGGSDPVVKQKIVDAASKALGVTSARISVTY